MIPDQTITDPAAAQGRLLAKMQGSSSPVVQRLLGTLSAPVKKPTILDESDVSETSDSDAESQLLSLNQEASNEVEIDRIEGVAFNADVTEQEAMELAESAIFEASQLPTLSPPLPLSPSTPPAEPTVVQQQPEPEFDIPQLQTQLPQQFVDPVIQEPEIVQSQPLQQEEEVSISTDESLQIENQPETETINDVSTQTESSFNGGRKETYVAPQYVAEQSATGSAGSSEQVAATPEVGSTVQTVESLRSPEIPVEVEKFLSEQKEYAESEPVEVIVADGTAPPPVQAHIPQKVVVLPITPEVEAEGMKHNHQWSIRWLVEFCHKIMKKFLGKVIYRQT